MSRTLQVSSGGGTLLLDGSAGVSAKLGVQGTGAAPVNVQWFEGAGPGKSFRGGRTLARVFHLPVTAYGDADDPENREPVRERLARLASILSLPNAPVRVTLDLDADSATGDKWWADMVKVGGGDFDWGADTDGRTFVKTVFTLEAGDPYWTSLAQESKTIDPVGVGLGLLAPSISLAQLRVGSDAGFGSTTIVNSGEVPAYPVWKMTAPFSGFSLTSSKGETLVWTAAKAGLGTTKTSGYIEVDTQKGTVRDETGANRYSGLDDAPQFWAVGRGSTKANVVLSDAGAASKASVVWAVRREVLF